MSDAGPAVEILPTAEAVARRAARVLADELAGAIAARGRAAFAVSGGRTPAQMLAFAAREPLSWQVVDLFQVDERFAPSGHTERNSVAVRASFATQLERFPERYHFMPVEQPNVAAAAHDYARQLEAVAGTPAILDLVHLGLGDDGHTASIFPGAAIGADAGDVIVTGAHRGWRRMTLTIDAINRTRFVLWVVTGSDKRAALAGLLRKDPSLVASRVRTSRALVLADALASPGG